MSITEDEINSALLGLRYLKEQRLSRINPYLHLAVLINSKHLQTEEIAENAKILMNFTRKLNQPKQMSLRMSTPPKKSNEDRKRTNEIRRLKSTLLESRAESPELGKSASSLLPDIRVKRK